MPKQPQNASQKPSSWLILPIVLLFIGLSLTAHAQKKTVPDSIPSFPDSTVKQLDSATIANEEKLRKEERFQLVAVEPSPVGGMAKFYQFLAANLTYPAEDWKNFVQGKVFIQFIVERDGSLSNFTTVRTPSKTLAEEAIRVLQLSPRWRPGVQNGKPVRVQFTVPITFNLNNQSDIRARFVSFYQFMTKKVIYPKEALDKELDGMVAANFTIDNNHMVSDVSIIKSTSKEFEDEITNKLKQYQPDPNLPAGSYIIVCTFGEYNTTGMFYKFMSNRNYLGELIITRAKSH